MLLADAGLSIAEISSLFAIWSVTGLVLEVPSGVLADVVSRRLLVAIGPLLAGAGFAVWVLAPSYPAFAAGFVLWGAEGALISGALEALVYEELDRDGTASRYAQVMGRATACATLAAAVATGLAAPVFAAAGFAGVAAASVLSCVAAAAVGATLPEHRAERRRADAGAGVRGYVGVLGAALREARSDRAVRTLLLVVPAVVAMWGALDEYLPLLAVDAGVAPADVPLIALVVYGAMSLGGLLAGPASRLSGPVLGGLVAAAATALAVGALAGVPAGFVAIAAAFGAFQVVTVVVDARLQDAIGGEARSTLTSLASLLTETVVIAVFAGYAAGSLVAGNAACFVAGAAVYLLVAPLVARAGSSQQRGPRRRR